MTNGFFLALAILFGATADGVFTQYKVVCCDGTVHYFHSISEEAYKKYFDAGTLKAESFNDLMGEATCKEHGGCYRSMETVPITLPQP